MLYQKFEGTFSIYITMEYVKIIHYLNAITRILLNRIKG